jgi:group I intron endonuclease
MIGIYKITNKINNKCYIGQSTNIEERWKAHKKKAFSGNEESNKEYNKALYKAFRKYGIDNFDFSVLEECPQTQLGEREAYYIDLYKANSNHHGYNETSGYEYSSYGMREEQHPNHKLTANEVYYIRECYNQHKDKNEVYEEFQDKINLTGFHKIWNNFTWKNIHQDVYTEENRRYYLFKRNSHPGSKNPRAKLNEQQVYQIRLRKKNGENCKDVYKDYKYTTITYRSFQQVWNYQNWKNIVV